MQKQMDLTQKKHRLRDAYNRILDPKNKPLFWVPGNEDTLKNLPEAVGSLNREHYTIAVCGQIKSGKSTLLNALVFGKPVLPVADTPHTTKVTLVKYGKKPCFTVSFLDRDAYQALHDNADESFQMSFRQELDRCAREGLMIEALLGQRETFDDLRLLDRYVSAKGKFTPLVAEVMIEYPAECLRDVVIVDTPGTNDANPVRDRITKEWIHKADAVLYCTYAGRTFDANDCDFIDKFLFTVPPSYRLFALSKIDTIDLKYRSNLNAYCEEIVRSDMNRERQLISDADSIIPISQLAALINAMESAKITLDESLAEEAELLEERGWLGETAQDDGFETLRAKLESCLLQNKGQRIIESHKGRIRGILQRSKRYFEHEIKTLDHELNNTNCTFSELEDRRQKIEKVMKSMDRRKREGKIKIEKIIEAVSDILKRRFDKTTEDIVGKINQDIEHRGKRELVKQAWRLINNVYDAYLKDLKQAARTEIDTAINEINNTLQTWQNDLNENLNFVVDLVSLETSRKVDEGLKGLYDHFESAFSTEAIRVAIANVGGEFLGFIETSKSLAAKKRTFGVTVENVIRTEFRKLPHLISANISSSTGGLLSEMNGQMDDIIKRELQCLESLQKENVDLTAKRQQLATAKDTVEQRLQVFESLQTTITQEVAL